MAHKHIRDHGPNNPHGGGVYTVAQGKVRAPAIAMLVVGILYLLVAIGGFVYVSNPAAFDTAVEKNVSDIEGNKKLSPEQRDNGAGFVTSTLELFEESSWLLLAGQVIAGVIILVGGIKMIKLTSVGWTRIGAMAAMIPCLSPVCVLGIPVGVWVLLTSLNDDVKEGFRRGPGVGPPRTDK